MENAYDSWNFVVAMDSPGGILWEGLEIGVFIREVGAKTLVQRYAPRNVGMPEFEQTPEVSGARCYSACALAFMGGLDREVPVGAEIGFHQFFGLTDGDVGRAVMRTQSVSAVLSGYLREMGAEPELFEMMSIAEPNEIFVPTHDELTTLGIVPSTTFRDFQLFPRDGAIVASAKNPRNSTGLQRVFEIETMCWKGRPVVNLYAESAELGLSAEAADEQRTWIDGFEIYTALGVARYPISNMRLYAQERILASLLIQPSVALSMASGDTSIYVNSPTVSGFLISGFITVPPGGDPAILASFEDCI
jgi:hypothetical protein